MKLVHIHYFKMVVILQGRCPDVYATLVARIHEYNRTANQKITVSIEIEKTKIQFSSLMPLGDIVSYFCLIIYGKVIHSTAHSQ